MRSPSWPSENCRAEMFTETRARFPNIDVALLPIAPVNPRNFMRHTHIDPREAVQAFLERRIAFTGIAAVIGATLAAFRPREPKSLEAILDVDREARAVARLKHPNIVEIYDYAGDAAVESYLVTEFIDGRLFAPPAMVEARKKEIEAEEHDPENFPEAPAAEAAPAPAPAPAGCPPSAAAAFP